MTNENTVCFNILTAFPIQEPVPGYNGSIGIIGLVLGIIYILNACVMIFFIRQQRVKAQDGMEGAAMFVIFPIYWPFLMVSVISDALVGMVIFLLKINILQPNPWDASLAIASVYSIQHFVLEGIAFTMMQYGCGFQAARKSAVWAFGWALTTFCVQLLVNRAGDTDAAFSASFLWNFTLIVFYLSLWLVPEKKLFRRPSIIFYAQVWSCYRIIFLVSETMIKFSSHNTMTYLTGYCTYAFGNILLCALFKPFVVYKTLLADSIWWQGVAVGGNSKRTKSKRDITLMNSDNSASLLGSSSSENGGKSKLIYEQLKNPLLGVEVGFSEAQELAQEVDKLRAQGSVRLLNFAYLSIQKKAPLLGSGSFSKVYLGKYRQHPVAIKMLFTPDLNPDVIRGCTNEAQILSRIRHENVVEIYGIAVLPPSVCIVLERCDYGSLSDVLRGSESMSSVTLPLQLTKADRMFLAMGCARGLEALHVFSSTLCHRDIKSFNFLVDRQLVAKIADLELGINCDPGDITDLHISSDNATTSSWQAPEVISTGNYTQASDIYSLALVLWEIVATSKISLSSTSPSVAASAAGSNSLLGKGGLPFAEFGNQEAIRKQILSGVRPQIPSGFGEHFNEVLARGWDPDPFQRPTASEVAVEMYYCWVSCVHSHLIDTKYIVDLSQVREANQHFNLNKDGQRVSLSEASRHPPTAALLSALLPLQLERRWMRLEDEGAFVVVSAEQPYYILWATKKWSKTTGYLINEVLSFHISLVVGPQQESEKFTKALDACVAGNAQHLICNNFRRDKTGYKNSIHMFPVFDGSGNESKANEHSGSKLDVPLKPTPSIGGDTLAVGNISEDSMKPLSNTSEQDKIESELADASDIATAPGSYASSVGGFHKLPLLAPESSSSETDANPRTQPPPRDPYSPQLASNHFSPLTFASNLFKRKKVSNSIDGNRKVAYIVIQFSALQEYKP